ncbi:metal ABC transporter permease, partial [Bacillus sp. GbtcB13]|uniref:metal ABC transporter permease n=1 Tax=Bacillus sp. GbtcB13 TaxID=2824758 RepID=UPI001C2F7AA3
NAFISGILIGLIAPLLGVFIVVRRLPLIADALSHVSLAGIAAGLYAGKQFAVLAGVSPIYFGMAFPVAGSLIIERLGTAYKHYQ